MAGRVIREYDIHFMQQALEYARVAFKEGEVPIGALVISSEGDIIGTGSNKTEQLHSQSRHAESIAIEQAGKAFKNWRLTDCTLYVTVEPCLMCFSLIGLSRISRVVYGASSPIFGYHLDKEELSWVYQKHIQGISSGVCAEESQKLLETFFREQRERREKYRSDKGETT